MSSSGSSSSDISDTCVKFLLPKFSKGYTNRHLVEGIAKYVDSVDIISLSRHRFPNEFIVRLSSVEVRNKLLAIGRIMILDRYPGIAHPMDNAICGKVHWIEEDVPDSQIISFLQTFGKMTIAAHESVEDNPGVKSNVRPFLMYPNEGVTIDMIPHFITIKKFEGLITIRGREPICFGCKQLGHLKTKCPSNKFKKAKKKAKGGIVGTGPPAEKLLVAQLPSTSQATTKVDATPNLSMAAMETLKVQLPNFVSEMQQLLQNVSACSKLATSSLDPTLTLTENSEASTSESKKKKKKKKKNKQSSEASSSTEAAPSNSTATQTKISSQSVIASSSGQQNATVCASGSQNVTNRASGQQNMASHAVGNQNVINRAPAQKNMSNHVLPQKNATNQGLSQLNLPDFHFVLPNTANRSLGQQSLTNRASDQQNILNHVPGKKNVATYSPLQSMANMLSNKIAVTNHIPDQLNQASDPNNTINPSATASASSVSTSVGGKQKKKKKKKGSAHVC